jgi:hypothetical protein
VAAGDVPLVCGIAWLDQGIPTEWTGVLAAGHRILVYLSDDWCATHPGVNNEYCGVQIERL